MSNNKTRNIHKNELTFSYCKTKCIIIVNKIVHPNTNYQLLDEIRDV